MPFQWILKQLRKASQYLLHFLYSLLSIIVIFSKKVHTTKQNLNFKLYPTCMLTHQFRWFKTQCSPFNIMENFLRFSCQFNIIPHNFNGASNGIVAAKGFKQIFWFLTVAAAFSVRGILFLSLPFLGDVKLRRVGDLVGLEELNMAIYIVIGSIVPIAFVVIWLFAQQADEIAALYNSYFLLDT